MDTAVSVAVVLASVALFIAAIFGVVVFGYLILILKNVLDGVRRFKKGTEDMGNDVQKAIMGLIALVPAFLVGKSRRKKRENKEG